MGGGKWNAQEYTRTTQQKVNTNTNMGYSSQMRSAPPSAQKAHDLLDPKRVNNDGDHKGQIIRESLDSTEHPFTTPIAIALDVTGSNIHNAVVVQKKLPTLLGILLRGGVVEDSQISVGAMGDAFSDRVPLQFAPFESDNRIDDHLDNFFLEGNGGGNGGESYGLYLYYLAKHTYTDSFEKRGKKGYAFLIIDEHCHSTPRDQIQSIIGDTDVEGTLTAEDAFKLAQEKWEVFALIPHSGVTGYDSLTYYRQWLGERAIELDNLDNTSEVIAALVRGMEGDDADDIDADLQQMGADYDARKMVGKALAVVGAGKGGGALATSSAPGGLDTTDDDTTTRI